MNEDDENVADRLDDLAYNVSEHVESIDQNIPDEWYVVGGAVRDALIGRESNDLDFVVCGESYESMVEHGFYPIEASSFPVFHDSEREEWALARTETKSGEGYHGFDVETEDVSLESDLKRRDLTINAISFMCTDGFRLPMYRETYVGGNLEWFLVDPIGGLDDIENGVLRHVSSAFSEDPLRIMRVARYAGRYPDFKVDDETMEMMQSIAYELNRVSRDRVGTELEKILLEARKPSRAIDVLYESGALAVLIPELDRCGLIPAGPEEYHGEGSALEHTKMVMDRMAELCDEQHVPDDERLRMMLMAMFHDVGKSVVASGINSDDPPTRFGGHELASGDVAYTTIHRYGMGRSLADDVATACELHMNVHDVPEMDAEELLDFYEEMGNVSVKEIVNLAHADEEGRLRDGDVPTFDRVAVTYPLNVARASENSHDGYTAMRDGLCDNHNTVWEDDVQNVLSSCVDCRSPGPWIGETIREHRIESIEQLLRD